MSVKMHFSQSLMGMLSFAVDAPPEVTPRPHQPTPKPWASNRLSRPCTSAPGSPGPGIGSLGPQF